MKIFALLFVALLGSASASADEQSTSRVVKIANGITQVDFTGEGVADMVVSGHRESYNAHSFDVVSFYVPDRHDTSASAPWDVVPVMTKGGEKWQVTVSGGADCVLHDFRLLAARGKEPATLIMADRDFGNSFADTAKVTFTFYSLVHNLDGIPGYPPYSFEQAGTVVAKRPYCDVEQAFDGELGIGAR
ncbi:MAG TPA: hypothetical protein VIF60_24250 [Burkholderiaceae bacterium]